MNNEMINTSIEGLKNVKEIIKSRVVVLESTIESAEMVLGDDKLPDIMKEIFISKIFKTYAEFNAKNEQHFRDNDLDEKLFTLGIINGLHSD